MPVLAATAALFAFGLAGADRGTPAVVPGAEAAPRQESRGAAAAPARRKEARSQRGKASYYGRKFNGRRMANGERFDPNSNSAAHRTLPLGTKAEVTNLENGRRETVEIEDRGPYVRDRVIDVSPRTAERLGMKEEGTAPVRVTPVEVPGRDERGREAQR